MKINILGKINYQPSRVFADIMSKYKQTSVPKKKCEQEYRKFSTQLGDYDVGGF